MCDWKYLYHAFKRLLSLYKNAHSNPEVGIQVLRHAMNPVRYSQYNVEKEAESLKLKLDICEDWSDIALLRDVFDELSNLGFSERTPAESVYQTAIQVSQQRIEDDINIDGSTRWFYRGQRNHTWKTVPKFMRDLPDYHDEHFKPLFEARLHRVQSIVDGIMQRQLANDDFDALAIAQHYSGELGISTWLLDVTKSPWIGLFFASDGGVTGDIGVLEYIGLNEWILYSNNGNSMLGSIRASSPTSVLRIQNQEAFFLQAPHPDLIKELSIQKLYFRQQDSVVFESEESVPALTRNYIYPKDDPTLTRLRELSLQHHDTKKISWEPTETFFKSPDYSTYLPITNALLAFETTERSNTLDPNIRINWQELLPEICKLHATIRSHRGAVPRYITTLHHLRRVIVSILVMGQYGPALFFDNCYFMHCKDDKHQEDAIRCCLKEASPFWESVLEEAEKVH